LEVVVARLRFFPTKGGRMSRLPVVEEKKHDDGKEVKVRQQEAKGGVAEGKADVALITLGNPGSGKSFTLNTLLGYERFVHRVAARAVTTDAECVSTRLAINGRSTSVLVWNLQGMTEPNAANATRNRAAWSAAFRSAPRQIVIFVTCHNNGRLRYEDVALFVQLMLVYRLRPDSTLLLLNGAPSASSLVPSASLTTAWTQETKTLFMRVTDFSDLRHCAVLRRLPRSLPLPLPGGSGVAGSVAGGAFDFLGADALYNASMVGLFLLHCVPASHGEHGHIELEDELLQGYRHRIEHAEHVIAEASRQHAEQVAASNRQRAALEADMAARDQRHQEACAHQLPPPRLTLVRSDATSAIS
jgi:hypothetical protein